MLDNVLKKLTILFATLILGALPARAQVTGCGAWAQVIGFKGSYTLTSSATNVQAGVWTVTMNSNASAKLTMGLDLSTCPYWSSPITDSTATGSFYSQGVRPFCSNGSNQVSTITASGPLLTGPYASSASLTFDLSNRTYTLLPAMFLGHAQDVVNTCGTTGTDDLPYVLAFPGDTIPSFPLPDSPQVLSGNVTFQAHEATFTALVPWTLTFSLTPIINSIDDDCKKSGSSTIRCRNQTLGEDIPVIGTGFFLHYQSDRVSDRTVANPVAIADALSLGGWTLNIHHAYDPASDTLFLGDGSQRSTWQLAGASTYNGNHLVSSEDGSEIHIFDGVSGLHLQTLKPLSGAIEYQFGYDAAGKLITVTDGSGNVTTIQRDGSETPTAIIASFGQTTTLSVDTNGFVNQVTDPAGNSATFTYTTGGLLTSRSDWNGNVYNYTYDNSGRLTNDADPAGGFTSLSRTDSGTGYTIATSTALGRTGTFQVAANVSGEQFSTTWSNGLQATMSKIQQSGQRLASSTLPDGTTSSSTAGPDPRWGLQTPITNSYALTLGSQTTNGSYTRTVTLGDPANPFSLATQTDTETINGRKYTSVFTGSTKTYVDTSPVGRQTTQMIDSLERISSLQIGSLLPVNFTYDSLGHLSTVTQGTRTTSLTYDTNGFLATVADPLNQITSLTHDADGRLVTSTLPDGRAVGYSYDANGNITAVTPPGGSAHALAYTAVNLLSSYTPPTVPGSGATSYTYDKDRALTAITRPDGGTINFTYDSAGRLSSEVSPTATINYAYSATTGNLTGASIQGGEALAYGYDGPLPTSTAWTGTVAGSLSRAYNSNFWVTSRSVNGGSPIAFGYDNDGLLTQAGALSLTHDASGLITGTTLGSLQDSWTYNGYGEPVSYTASYSSTPLYSVSFSRDTVGRIGGKQETINGATNSYSYTYDTGGRLSQAGDHSYTYDSDSNRLTDSSSSGSVNGTYDAQDRLLTYGTASYAYTGNGELASRTDGTQVTSFQYDVLGNLVAAILPDGTAITYAIDAANRRVGKKINGQLMQGFLYDGDRVVAQMDGKNQIVSQFIYATTDHSPDYLLQAGVTYRILTDQLGSPRLVVNTSTGQIVQQIDYDAFGNVLNDTNPGFQPFGFAGGLYDRDTKLVRFGARDYDPNTGRWTAKDPILFTSGDTNLYGYVFNDPVNLRDPAGLEGEDCACKAKSQIEAKTPLRARAKLHQPPPPLKQFVGEHERAVQEATEVGDILPGTELGRHIAELISGSDASGNTLDREEKSREVCRDILKEIVQHIIVDFIFD